MSGRLGRIFPRFLLFESLLILSCTVASSGLFVYAWATGGFRGAAPLLGLVLGCLVGLAMAVKFGRMIERGWDRRTVNQTAFGIMILSTALIVGLVALSSAAAFMVYPAYLFGLWRLDAPARRKPRGGRRDR